MSVKKEMEEKMLRSIEKKLGVRPQLIMELVRKQNMEKHSDRVEFIKAGFGLTHGFANLLAHKSQEGEEKSQPEQDDLINEQYLGKESLRPILDQLMFKIESWEGVDVSPKKTYVSLRTKKQFAIIQPSTKTRVDLGLKLKGIETTEILEKSGSFNSMVSHRIRLEKLEDINESVTFFLKLAYEQSK